MANCKDVYILVQNSADVEVKVTKFEYKDGSNWKTENMFGLDGFQKIEKDQHFIWVRDLEGIRNESTQFRVTFRRHIGGTAWASEEVVTTATFTCSDNERQFVTLTH